VAAALVIAVAALAGGAPSHAAHGGVGEPPSASQELQGTYPLRDSLSCCRIYTGDLPTRPELARPLPGDSESPSPPPLAALVALLAVGGLILTLVARATLPAARSVRAQLPPGAHPSRPAPYMQRPPRPEHAVSPVVIRLARPLFRYSYGLDGYVLRLIGGRRGPVLRERRPPPDQLW
jgi:hypothetical protein